MNKIIEWLESLEWYPWDGSAKKAEKIFKKLVSARPTGVSVKLAEFLVAAALEYSRDDLSFHWLRASIEIQKEEEEKRKEEEKKDG